MGICSSCESTAVVPTAKVILQDGRLQEFSGPVKVSHLLQKDPTCFVCNADDMEFEGFVSSISADEELHPGHLYFSLPLSMLRWPLHAEDMAALAVKASTALVKSGAVDAVYGGDGCGFRRGSVAPMGVPGGSMVDAMVRESRLTEERKRQKGSGRGRNKYTSQLGAIAEERIDLDRPRHHHP